LNVHEITVYPLQNRLLVIGYSDSSVAVTLHLRRCSKPLSQLARRFQLSQNDILWGGFWAQVRAVRWVEKRCNIMLSQKYPHRNYV